MQTGQRLSTQHLPVLESIPTLAYLSEIVAPFKGVCFDMDGTLLNSEPLHARAIWQMLPQKPVLVGDIYFENEDQLNHHFCGQCDDDVFEALKQGQPAWKAWRANDFISEKNNNLLTGAPTSAQEQKDFLSLTLVPQMIELLKELKAKGIPCALVSASQEEVVNDFVSSLKLEKYFDLWIGATEGSRTKPHPDPYLMACQKLGLLPHETLAFEDSQTGMVSAREAGLTVVQAKWF